MVVVLVEAGMSPRLLNRPFPLLAVPIDATATPLGFSNVAGSLHELPELGHRHLVLAHGERLSDLHAMLAFVRRPPLLAFGRAHDELTGRDHYHLRSR
jgi:hypothetical protein